MEDEATAGTAKAAAASAAAAVGAAAGAAAAEGSVVAMSAAVEGAAVVEDIGVGSLRATWGGRHGRCRVWVGAAEGGDLARWHAPTYGGRKWRRVERDVRSPNARGRCGG